MESQYKSPVGSLFSSGVLSDIFSGKGIGSTEAYTGEGEVMWLSAWGGMTSNPESALAGAKPGLVVPYDRNDEIELARSLGTEKYHQFVAERKQAQEEAQAQLTEAWEGYQATGSVPSFGDGTAGPSSNPSLPDLGGTFSAIGDVTGLLSSGNTTYYNTADGGLTTDRSQGTSVYGVTDSSGTFSAAQSPLGVSASGGGYTPSPTGQASYGGSTLGGGGSSGGTSSYLGGGSPDSQFGSNTGTGSPSSSPSSSGSSGGGNYNVPTSDTNSIAYGPSPYAYAQAADAETAQLTTGLSKIRSALGSAQTQARDYGSSALSALQSTYGIGENELKSAFDGAASSLTSFSTKAQQQLTSSFQQAQQLYQPIAQQANADLQRARQVAMGDIGDQFNQYKQTAAFQQPYQEAVGTLESSAASRGMLRSGETLKDISKFASDYTSQQFNQFQQNRFNQLADIAGRSTGALQQQAGLVGQQGTNLANLSQSTGQGLSGLRQAQGSGLLNAATQLGQQKAGANLDTATVRADLSKSLAEAEGQGAAAKGAAQSSGILGRSTKAIEIKV